MTTCPPSPTRSPGKESYVVRRPQVGDLLGATLCNAYVAVEGLPEDMARAIARLDRLPARH
ncbi:hypothetical protein [Sphingomonas sp. Leaf17]|uniref:hypothetical protein n=1 Tax=Sphingomonas sp. Leaf17 TaxID=1735683 RepID=UPI0012E1EC69|nr:hypothetical protein [Sphingomonas sp. Leaf17]